MWSAYLYTWIQESDVLPNLVSDPMAFFLYLSLITLSSIKLSVVSKSFFLRPFDLLNSCNIAWRADTLLSLVINTSMARESLQKPACSIVETQNRPHSSAGLPHGCHLSSEPLDPLHCFCFPIGTSPRFSESSDIDAPFLKFSTNPSSLPSFWWM